MQVGDETPREAALLPLATRTVSPAQQGNAADSNPAAGHRPKTSVATQRDAPPLTQVIGGAWSQCGFVQFARSGGVVS
ncbi:hypothetical protein GCM10022403_025320 [Streptomyces coacervatus]|uniref:Uncharacterized protein n=1 Tax=Streptomyces coacervatus TaxID=647381 RepID=A0ABP7HB26_9ACTN